MGEPVGGFDGAADVAKLAQQMRQLEARGAQLLAQHRAAKGGTTAGAPKPPGNPGSLPAASTAGATPVSAATQKDAQDRAEQRRQRALAVAASVGQATTQVEVRPARDAAPSQAAAWTIRALGALAIAAAAAQVAPHLVDHASKQVVPVQQAAQAATVMPQAARVGQADADRANLSSQYALRGASLRSEGRAVFESQFLAPLQVVVKGERVQTLNPLERVVLCQEVAEEQGLTKVGKDWKDLYAVVHAETGWAPRDGMGRNGRVSRGLGQLEDATARALGIDDPHDPRQALKAAAMLLKEASVWAGRHGPQAAVSVYYNLSTKARNEWDRQSVASLPPETQAHVANFADGRRIAESLGRQRVAFDRMMSTMDTQDTVKVAHGAAPAVKMTSAALASYPQGTAAPVASVSVASIAGRGADQGLGAKLRQQAGNVARLIERMGISPDSQSSGYRAQAPRAAG